MWSKKIFLMFSLFLVQALALNSFGDDLNLMKGALAFQNKGDLVKAAEILENLLKEKTTIQEYIHFYYAQNLSYQKRTKEAREQFQKILTLSPNLKLKQDTQYQLAVLAVDESHFRQARVLLTPLERKLRREEMYPELIFLLGRAEMGLKNTGRACKWWKKLFVHYPSFSKISHWGPYLAGNKIEDHTVGCSVDTEGLRLRLKNLQRAGLTEKTENELKALKEGFKDGDEDIGDRLEVSVLLQEGEVYKAVDILLKNYEKRKNDLLFLSSLANASARAGELPLAVGSFYRVFKLAPHSRKGKEALYQSAFLSYQFQDYDGASRRFKEFIKNFRGSGLAKDAEWNLAWIRYLKGDYQGSLKAFNKLLKVRSSNLRDRVRYWTAMSHLRQGNIDSAQDIFESLAGDRLLGYYAVAAQNRLAKISKQILRDSRLLETKYCRDKMVLQPDDGFESASDSENYTSEGYESEESLASALASSEESQEEFSEAGSDRNSDLDGDKAEVVSSFENPKLFERFSRARDLIAIGLYDWAKWDLLDIERKTRNKDYLKKLMQEYESVGSFNRISFIAQTFFGTQRIQQGMEEGRFLWESAYPRAYQSFVFNYARKFDLPTELIWGVMKQESQFKRDAISPAGALGLMQVMPHTGLKVSELGKDSNFDPKSLLEPEGAIKVGARYLQRLMRKFENNIVLVATGYNAGPHRVNAWLNSFGNLDLDEFVEHIPFLETRNYVKKVISNVHIYAQLYGGRKNILNYISDPVGSKLTDTSANAKNSTRETWEEI